MTVIYKLVGLFEKGCVLFFVSLIKIYKLSISVILPASCRYYPTCSSYSIDAMRKHGLLKGCYLTGKRILSCNPFCEGGYDPVPDNFRFFKNR
ncbi:MAG: membrane protein insertion efficiency factor YidD [Spirochaetia bacterium]|jgi:putative membrane protein insertion efficiency factor|nr:membrane protein insertion efficiency factor YidD [Spirochaetia bacterium]